MQEPKKFSSWRIIGVCLIVIGVSMATITLYLTLSIDEWYEISLLAFPLILSFIGVGAIFLFDKEA